MLEGHSTEVGGSLSTGIGETVGLAAVIGRGGSYVGGDFTFGFGVGLPAEMHGFFMYAGGISYVEIEGETFIDFHDNE